MDKPFTLPKDGIHLRFLDSNNNGIYEPTKKPECLIEKTMLKIRDVLGEVNCGDYSVMLGCNKTIYVGVRNYLGETIGHMRVTDKMPMYELVMKADKSPCGRFVYVMPDPLKGEPNYYEFRRKGKLCGTSKSIANFVWDFTKKKGLKDFYFNYSKSTDTLFIHGNFTEYRFNCKSEIRL